MIVDEWTMVLVAVSLNSRHLKTYFNEQTELSKDNTIPRFCPAFAILV
jgi:hypothetical protein